MTNPSQTGSFWICPSCRKHVPTRLQQCRCGARADATNNPVATVSLRSLVEEGESRAFPWRTVALVAAAVALAGGAAYISVEAWRRPAPEQSEIARRIREKSEAQSRPQIVYVEVPTSAPQVTPEAGPETGDGADTSLAMPGSPMPSEEVGHSAAVTHSPVEARPQAPTSAPEPAPAPYETEYERQRRTVAVPIERRLASLAELADEADIAYERYLAGCRKNVTESSAVAGVGTRTWFALAASSVRSESWTEACAEAGKFYALARRVSQGVCQVEEEARRASVLPGILRELRAKYGLDWSGWDQVCM